tara:strand:+ start:1351 stop:2382 length:1032 start_codon:yes stop_codon:yes gene_type:complete
MKKILFFDSVAPYEYNFNILDEKGIGASESYLLHIANELKKKFEVEIATQFVKYNHIQKDIVFKKLQKKELSDHYDIIIIQRNPQNVRQLKELYPKAKIFIWLHDFFESSVWTTFNTNDLEYILKNSTLICVSNWHKKNYAINFKLRKIKNSKIEFINFFIPDHNDIKNENIDYDKNKLCFFSAGHKGLEFSVEIFKHLYKFNPKFKLYVGNPTYDQKYDFSKVDGIINLGSIPRSKVLHHQKESLLQLHLNKEYPETFGCVNAEANMVGTPVLCYDLGATREILYNPTEQFVKTNRYRVDNHDITHIVEKVFKWRESHRPEMKLKDSLQKEKVIKKWIEILS